MNQLEPQNLEQHIKLETVYEVGTSLLTGWWIGTVPGLCGYKGYNRKQTEIGKSELLSNWKDQVAYISSMGFEEEKTLATVL